MKKLIPYFIVMLCWGFTFGQVTISPYPFEVNQNITITVDANSSLTDCNGFSTPSKVYIHSGIGNDSDPWGYKVVGNWGQDDGVGEMTYNGDGTWSISFVPETYYSLTPTQAQNAIKMGMVFRNANGTQEFKGSGCADFYFDVGSFQVSLSSPAQNSTTILSAGDNLTINASNIGGNANYVLKSNGTIINSQSAISSYSFNHTNITTNQVYSLDVSLNGATISKEFTVLINPGSTSAVMPTTYQDGITYISDSEAVLVLYAPYKDFVYVAGSFNNWQPNASYAMKTDPTRNNKFWITLTGLTSGQLETYQYWVVDNSPPSNSPKLVKTADPYSTLVLSPFDDGYIPSSSYPDLPDYPTGQEREVTVIQTGQSTYDWQVTNFQKPAKEDLIIYELLIRDFDTDRNFQDVIDKIDYFKNLNINAIQLMPIMEFEGNESWGYNTAFHMALDKFYGTQEKFKELVDICHQNGIAVILDLAINHAFGRNPMVRMWMKDSDEDGWGEPSSQNPYFNETAKHSYNVGNDFNHQSGWAKLYTKRVIKHWIEEYKIDGFRWDLTKGFTQNCTASDEGCTGSYQADRVAVLKEYADYSWSLDSDHYVIFEHLGGDGEEKEWADYRLNEGKGIMLWGKMTEPYNQLSMGHSSNPIPDISRIRAESRGFNGKRLVGFSESHDEERLMYKNIQYGNSTQSGHNVKNLNVALGRMSAIGAVSLLVPGPKMIWHFGDLGMEQSLNTCSDGIVNNCRLDTKPQPQWTNNWLTNTQRKKIYDDWSRMNNLKQNNAVFRGNSSISPLSTNNLVQRIYIWDNSLSGLKNVVILANFDVTTQNVTSNFPFTGTWYNLMDDSTLSVSSTAQAVTLAPGEFKIFGNQQATLSNHNPKLLHIGLRQNPVNEHIEIDLPTEDEYSYKLYSALGQEVLSGKHKNRTLLTLSAPTQKGVYFVVLKNSATHQFGLCKVLVE